MKKIYLAVAVLLVVIIAGYLFRHQLKSLFMKAPEGTNDQVMEKKAPNEAMVPTDNIYKTATDPKLGAYMTDFSGRALYTYDKDLQSISNCEGQCLANWPAYTSGATAQKTFPENISVIKRSDGSEQFAWKGMPLYYYIKDAKAGDVTGDGVGGVWHIVKP